MEFIFIVIPAFIIFGIGYIGQKVIGFDRKSISTAALYLMYPFLAFRTFYTNKITIEYLYILIFCLLLCIILIVVAKMIAKINKAEPSKLSAMILSGVFMNSGNYGVPIVLFAYHGAGFDYAVIMMVIQSLLMNTIGLYYAAKGSSEGNSIKESLMKVVRMPIIYGVISGVIVQVLSVEVPTFIIQAVDLVADAAIPTVMIVLGMQLASISIKKVKFKDVSIIIVMRMVLSPIIAYFLVLLLPIDGLLASILILLSAMPTAANTTMYSLQFNTEPDLVSYSTLITTLISIITIPIMFMIIS